MDDPRLAILEELRELGGFRNMNAVYVEALLIGAVTVLAQARDLGFVPSGEVTPAHPPEDEFVFPVPPKAKIQTFQAPAGEPKSSSIAPANDEVVVEAAKEDVVVQLVSQAPTLRVPPLEMPRLGIPPRPSTSAADAQFDRFGD